MSALRPAFDTSLPESVTFNEVALEKLISRSAPFQRAIEPGAKFDPVRVRVTGAVPVLMLAGVTDWITGARDGLSNGKLRSHTLRPRVLARSVRLGRCRFMLRTDARGSPVE